MIAVVQRVLSASVEVDEPAYKASIDEGLLILLGVATQDDDDSADWMAGKLAKLRIFKDEQGRMNRSVQETGGQVLLVSQFTLLGNTAKGNRPTRRDTLRTGCTSVAGSTWPRREDRCLRRHDAGSTRQ